MRPHELSIYLDYLGYAHRVDWEQARFIAYVSALPNVDRKKHPKFSPKDLQEFIWERDEEEHDTHISREDIHRLQSTSNSIDIDFEKELEEY